MDEKKVPKEVELDMVLKICEKYLCNGGGGLRDQGLLLRLMFSKFSTVITPEAASATLLASGIG